MSETDNENGSQFFQDFSKLQKSVEALHKSAENPFHEKKYVPLNQVLGVVKKNCQENNFIFFQAPAIDDNGISILRTTILHQSGEKIIGEIPLVAKDPNDPQKVGASITYMRRYSLVAIFGLEDDDDDGNSASGRTAGSGKKATEKKPASDQPKVWFNPKNAKHIEALKKLRDEGKDGRTIVKSIREKMGCSKANAEKIISNQI